MLDINLSNNQLMATTQTIKVTLQRDSLQTPWGFRLQGGADFHIPFSVNKINAGSPADGNLYRNDIILEINQKPISGLHHTDALNLIQRAGGEITFLVERETYLNSQRPASTISWAHGNVSSSWSPTASQLKPMSYFRNRPLERIPEPKPVLSQTGSPIMPGPVPCVSTKTRGYIQPPSFHTDRNTQFDSSPHSPGRFYYPGPTYHPRNRTLSATVDSSDVHHSETYIPSYQRNVHMNSNIQTHHYNPTNLVHRQFNSPISLYSNANVQEVINNHVNQINHIPSIPKQSRYAYYITLIPSYPIYLSSSAPVHRHYRSTIDIR